MATKKREGFAARLLEESAKINEGLKELDLAQDPESDEEIDESVKEAYLMREIERRNQEIRDLQETQNDLLVQLKEFEQENLKFSNENKELKNELTKLEKKKGKTEDLEADKITPGKEPTLPRVDINDLVNDLKTYSPLFARGSVSHGVAESTYNQMRDIMRQFEEMAPVKRIRDVDLWNVAMWLMCAIFNDIKDLSSVKEMAKPLKNNTDATEVLLQFYLIMLAHLGIDKV